MKHLKKLLVLIAVICFIPGIVGAQELNPILVYVKGEPIELAGDVQTINRDGRICLPVRKISEKMDYKVDWDGKAREVTLTKDDKEVTVAIDQKAYTANGEKKTMDVAPFIKNNRTYLPMRFIGEALGEKIEWDEANRVAMFGEYPINQEFEGEKVDLFPGYSFVIPDDLKDKIVCERHVDEDVDIVILSEKQNHATQWSGMLGNFVIVDYPDDATQCFLLDRVGDKYLMFYRPGDVNSDPDNKELNKAYQDMVKEVPRILTTVQVAK